MTDAEETAMMYRAVFGLPEPPSDHLSDVAMLTEANEQKAAVLKSIVEALDLSMERDDLATVWRRIDELKSRPANAPELARLEALYERSAVEPVTADDYCAALRAYLETVRPIR